MITNNDILRYLVDYLKKIDYDLYDKNEDGRINSIISEDIIIEELLKLNEADFFINNQLTLVSSKSRDWSDFYIVGKTDEELFIPINLKITRVNRNFCDNTNAKLGVFYSLTGIIPIKADVYQSISWNDYFKKLFMNLGYDRRKSRDYYFLIVNKDDTSDIFFTSLKQIKEVQARGNNLPFQATWNNNRELIHRTYQEHQDHMLGVMQESFELMSNRNNLHTELFDLRRIKTKKDFEKDLFSKYNIDYKIVLNDKTIMFLFYEEELATDKEFYIFVKKLIKKYFIDLNLEYLVHLDILREFDG